MVKKKNFKILSLVMTLALIFSNLTGLDGLRSVKAAAGDKVFDLVEITDFHGSIVSSDATPLPAGAVLAQNIKAVKNANPDRTLIIGGGDLYQGSPISNVLRGVPVQKVLSNIGMEVTALGNHEFDWGLDIIKNTTMKDAAYSIVCANLYDKNTNNRVFDPYKIITKDGVRIALIGAITTETPSIVMPAMVENYKFVDPADEINTIAAKIKNDHAADVILAVIHEGDNLDNKTGPIFDVANKLTNVDAVFGGHSHSKVYTKSSKGTNIYIANSSGKGYINVKMTVKSDGTVSFPDPTANDYVAIDTTNANGYKAATPIQDPAVKAIVDAASEEVGPVFSEVIGSISSDATKTQIGSPYGESYLGNWATDVVRAKTNADVSLANNGGLRTNFNKGNITVGQVYYFMPFDNEINTVTMNKTQLKGILEQAFSTFQDPTYPNDPTKTLGGKGIQVSGIKIKYDNSKPALKKIVDITRADGSAIGDNEKLKVAGPDFVLTGGDGFINFKEKSIKDTLINTHIIIRDALIEDVRKNGTIKTTMDSRVMPVKTISVVATSDIHGNVLNYDYNTAGTPSKAQGLAKVSTYVNGLRAANNNNVMLVDNGDTIQGTPLVYYYNLLDTKTLYPMAAVMGAMKYDTWTLGNHEFNYGLDTLNRIMTDMKSKGINVLSGNIYKEDGKNYVEPYYIKSFDVNGKTIKVGILGLTTKTVPSWEDAAHYKGLHFNDLVDEAKKWVPKVREAGADVVIVTAHSGEESANDVIPENQIKAVATQVKGIDAIVAGHAHNTINDLTLKNPDGKIVPVVEPNKWGTNVSQIDIAINAEGNFAGLTTKNVAMDNTIAEDPAIVNIIKPYHDVTLDYVKTKIGVSTGEFKGAGQYVVATPIMDLINKVQMESANAQLSIAAPLSSSAYIPSGDVTIQNIMSVYVFENFLYGVKMTGKQLNQWLEYSARYYKQINDSNLKIDINTDYKSLKDTDLNVADYNLDMLYGATYDVDLTQPATQVDKEGNVTKWGTRIKNLKYNGKFVKDTDVFTVAINNYRYNGGGGFMKAVGLSNTDPSVVTYDSGKALGDDGQVRSLMIEYIKNHKTITPDCSNNWRLYTTAVREQNVPVSNDTSKVVDAIKNSPAKSNTIVDITNNTKVAKEIFEAIKGQDKTVTFEMNGVSWTFNGLDINPELIKDIDLSLKTVSDELKAKEAAKIKAVVGKDVAIVPFSFTYEGKLPGKATVKVFIGKDWANKAVYINRYYADKNTYEIITDVIVDADGYITFTTDHCSDYFVMEKAAAPNLPKTGSPIDFTAMIDLGAMIALLGGAMMFIGRKKREGEEA